MRPFLRDALALELRRAEEERSALRVRLERRREDLSWETSSLREAEGKVERARRRWDALNAAVQRLVEEERTLSARVVRLQGARQADARVRAWLEGPPSGPSGPGLGDPA